MIATCPKCATPTEQIIHGRNVSARLCPTCNTIYERRLPDSLTKPKASDSAHTIQGPR